MFRKVELWVVALLCVCFLIVLILYGGVIRYEERGGEGFPPIRKTALFLADIPSNIRKIIENGNQSIIKTNIEELNDYSKGFLLVSAYDPNYSTSTVYLYDLINDEIIHRWIPPVNQIKESVKHDYPGIEQDVFQPQHPLLNNDGGIVFTSNQGPLVKIDACSKIEWVTDRHFHHSVEKTSEGNVVVPIVVNSNENYLIKLFGEDVKKLEFRDDGFAEVDVNDGKVVNETSVTKILIDNNYGNLVRESLMHNPDIIHLNDAEPIKISDDYVKEGDIMLSVRNMSFVALYRPQTKKIIWLQQGPWSQQHDIDYQGNGIFTIFGNDTYHNGTINGYNTIYQYDMKTDVVSEFLSLKIPDIYTKTEGLHTILPENDVFIEETNKGVLHIIDQNGNNKLRFVSKIQGKEGKHGYPHWSRFINDGVEIQDTIDLLKQKSCN